MPAAFSFNSAIGAGSAAADGGTAVATDAAGNTYLAGFVGDNNATGSPPGTATLGGVAVSAGAFVAKFDPAGNCLWAVNVGGTDANGYRKAGVAGLAVDGGGNLLVAGNFSGSFVLGPVTLTSTTFTDPSGTYFSGDAFVAKFDPAGNCVWATSAGGPGTDAATAVAVDSAGNPYVTGSFVRQVSFGPFTLNPGVNNGFVAKLDPAGTFVWADGFGTPVTGNGQAVSPSGIAVDGGGNAYVAGAYMDTVDFDPGPKTYNLTSMNRRGGYPSTDIFVMKLTAGGALAWADSMGSASTYGDGASAVAVDGTGNVYVAGSFADSDFSNTASNNDFDPGKGTYKLDAKKGHGFVEKLDTNGKFVWAVNLDVTPRTIAADGSGTVYVGGSFRGAVDFDPGLGTYTLTSRGGSDGFVLALNGAGTFLAAVGFGGDADDTATAITVGPAGRVRVTGSFADSATFGPFGLTTVGGTDVYNAPQADLFLADLTLT